MSTSFPAESPEYRAARDQLLQREIELRRATEAVAAARRELPPGGLVPQDYIFEAMGGNHAPKPRKLSELFAPGNDSLAIYSFMFSAEMKRPCPMCTSFLDSLDAAAQHITQRVNLAVAAKSPISRIVDFAKERGWRYLQLLSSAGNTYNHDYFGEDEKGQQPILNVFRKVGTTVRHFWGSELMFAPPDPGQDTRHVDALGPVWNLFDFTPDGRGKDWYTKLSYGESAGPGPSALSAGRAPGEGLA
jgi:predicted dithiol-disulfide oxidoreductase (DUF899 family)